ncbi:hypothetical protein [Coprobacter sp.]
MKKLNNFLYAVLLCMPFQMTMAQTPETLAGWDFAKANEWASSANYNEEEIDGVMTKVPIKAEFSSENNAEASLFTEGGKNHTTIKGQTGFIFTTNFHWPETETTTPDGQYYIINKVNTMKYFGIRISFEMWGSGSGARDFCIEYQVGTEEDPWVKLDNSDFQNTEERQNHVFALPKSCDGQANINIRIKRTSTEGISKTISSGGQVRLDNLFITGFAEPTTPTIFSTLDEVEFCNAVVGTPMTQTITITGKKLNIMSSNLSLSTKEPFSIDKTTIIGTFGIANSDIVITFTPTEEGEFNEVLTISGGDAPDKKITLRGVTTNSGEESAVSETTLISGIKIYGSNGNLIVEAEESNTITIFNLAGSILKESKINAGIQKISLPAGQFYLVKIGNQTMKVAL